MTRERVLVAMSGGVDSSVAAALLVQRGYEVIGVTMKLFCFGDDMPDRPCCSIDSVREAAAVAELLGISHHVLNLADSFESMVIRDFVTEYERGRTPIPCVRCNAFIKFKDLLKYADAFGCRHIATGHYATVRDGALYRGADRHKDQTYFLWAIDRATIDRLLLPLGKLTKPEVRKLARRLCFGNADRPESVEICFVPNDDYVAVLERHLAPDSPALSRGEIRTSAGEVVGEHGGYARFTVGQRRGLPGGFPEAMYVISISPEERSVVIGPEVKLLGDHLSLGAVNWLAPPLGTGDSCRVSTRYRSPLVDAHVSDSGDGDDGTLELKMSTAVRAIAPGQSGVLYDSDGRLLGGGVIQ